VADAPTRLTIGAQRELALVQPLPSTITAEIDHGGMGIVDTTHDQRLDRQD
jgi:hypothetical protein